MSESGAMRNVLLGASLLVLVGVLLAGGRRSGGATAPATAAGADISGVWQLAAPLPVLMTAAGEEPPLLPAARQLYADRKAGKEADPAAKCKPLGEPRAMLQDAWPFQILQSAGRIDILYQWNRLVHVIAMKDKHGPEQGPFYFGESVGHWEGDALVIDVINPRDESWLDISGLPHSVDMHMIERLRTIDGGRKLEARFSIDDAATYSMPWEAVLTFERRSTLLREDICIERLKINDYASLDNGVKH